MADDRPNVLFLFSDEHSFRCFGHRDEDDGGEPVETPTFDRLAESSVAFDRTYCSMPLCTPSRLCTLTGREARNAGAWSNGSHLTAERRTLPELLGTAGYETCHVGKMHVGGPRQFAGFDHRPYGDLAGNAGGSHQPDPPHPDATNGLRGLRTRTADAGRSEIPESLLQERNIVEESVSWLRGHRHRRGDQPWFLCASFSRPHFPLTAPPRHLDRYWPEGVPDPVAGPDGDTAGHPMTRGVVEGFRTDEIGPEEEEKARAAYFACVSYLDEILGDFLATLERTGFLEDTIVVYAADHGELAGEHGLWWKHTWHEAAARVPWFLQLPAHRAGELAAKRFETPVSLVDLFPTVCGLTGVDAPADLDGVDLSGSVRTGTEPDRGPVYTDNLVPRWGDGTEFRMVRDGQYKYVGFRDAPEILIDLEADPNEQTNLAPDASGDAAEALTRLRSLVGETMDFEAAERERLEDERQQEETRLGTPTDVSNAYHMPDGTIVAADSPLYRPHVLMEDPAAVIEDFPDN